MFLSIAVFLLCQYCLAYTVIMKSGKTIHGTLLFDEQNTIRIRDESGVLMSLNKSSLDLEAMSKANAVPEPTASAYLETADRPDPKPSGAVLSREPRKFTNRSSKVTLRELNRLRSECRSAGGNPSSRVFKTSVYTVNGKKVKVAGYWADPRAIAQAKDVCQKAVEAQLQWNNENAASSTSSGKLESGGAGASYP